MATTTEDLAASLQAVVTLTPEALTTVRDAMAEAASDATAGEAEGSSMALWLEVRGVQEGVFLYDLYFQTVSDADAGDARHTQDGLEIVVPAGSIERLRGA